MMWEIIIGVIIDSLIFGVGFLVNRIISKKKEKKRREKLREFEKLVNDRVAAIKKEYPHPTGMSEMGLKFEKFKGMWTARMMSDTYDRISDSHLLDLILYEIYQIKERQGK